MPITVAGMSFGALSARVKDALGRGDHEVGTSTTTGDGGMTPRSATLRSTGVSMPAVALRFNPDDLRQADAIEVVIGQGAKPGGGGMLLGQKVVRAWRACALYPRGSISARRAVIRTGPGRTTGDQDQGAARDHRLAKADLREGWRNASYSTTSSSRCTRARM